MKRDPITAIVLANAELLEIAIDLRDAGRSDVADKIRDAGLLTMEAVGMLSGAKTKERQAS